MRVLKVEKQLEERIASYTSLLLGLITLIGAIINVIFIKESKLLIPVLFISIFYLSIFLYIRLKSFSIFIKYIITISSIVFLNLVWYYNFWSQGAALGNFIFIYVFILLVWDNKNTYLFTSIIFLNIFILFYYEANQIEFIPHYKSTLARIFDTYLGNVFILIIVHFYTSFLKNNYITQLNRAKKSDELKTTFLANLSHEIRTPLNSIIGFSELITTDDITDDEKKMYNGIIQTNSYDLLTLIEDIVDLSLIESDEIKLVKTKFELNDLLEKLHIEYIKMGVNDKPIEIIYNRNDEKVELETDILRVRQIFKNLINNSIKYTNEGDITFGYRKSSSEVIFYVEDTGIGIHKSEIKNVFNRFFKIEDKSEIYRGIGIGLHLSKRIANMLGGDIWVESVFGVGSTFYFKLPLKSSDRKS